MQEKEELELGSSASLPRWSGKRRQMRLCVTLRKQEKEAKNRRERQERERVQSEDARVAQLKKNFEERCRELVAQRSKLMEESESLTSNLRRQLQEEKAKLGAKEAEIDGASQRFREKILAAEDAREVAVQKSHSMAQKIAHLEAELEQARQDGLGFAKEQKALSKENEELREELEEQSKML